MTNTLAKTLSAVNNMKAELQKKDDALSEALQDVYDLQEKIATLEESLEQQQVQEAQQKASEQVPALDWCDIPGGEVEIKNEKIEIKPFRMSKFPITNEQYNAFVEAEDGYRNPVWWEDMPEAANQNPKESHWKEPNCPRENVSWFEATAFCRWLSSKLGYTIRLPHESQWQWAAQSCNPDNKYPWGTEMVIENCNVNESGIGRTTPVDKYASGQTAQGVYDMIGNTWEWCANVYHKS